MMGIATNAIIGTIIQITIGVINQKRQSCNLGRKTVRANKNSNGDHHKSDNSQLVSLIKILTIILIATNMVIVAEILYLFFCKNFAKRKAKGAVLMFCI